jgi:hypothetical protein
VEREWRYEIEMSGQKPVAFTRRDVERGLALSDEIDACKWAVHIFIIPVCMMHGIAGVQQIKLRYFCVSHSCLFAKVSANIIKNVNIV